MVHLQQRSHEKKTLFLLHPSIVQGVLLLRVLHTRDGFGQKIRFFARLAERNLFFKKSFVQGLGGRSWFFAIKGWNNALLKEMCTLWFPLESGSHNK